jgi:predicted nucleic acid-binding protein
MKHHLRPHVLDANALLRFLTKGAGWEIVKRVLDTAQKANRAVTISVINWGEVLFHLAKRVGYDQAEARLSGLRPLVAVVAADDVMTAAAVRFRLERGMSYADSFAAVLAGTQGVLVTADRDFGRVAGLRVLWLPPHERR